jgi:hypothetical protein
LFLLILKNEERERLKWREIKMRDVNIGERETWNESERLGEKESVEREEKKGERERETYERIQGMRKKKKG